MRRRARPAPGQPLRTIVGLLGLYVDPRWPHCRDQPRMQLSERQEFAVSPFGMNLTRLVTSRSGIPALAQPEGTRGTRATVLWRPTLFSESSRIAHDGRALSGQGGRREAQM